ncbi:MAG: glycosyltransferase [Gemmatimonadota bacterium]|jgi:processive 1,2-diacylglycerol beta-glucosyltransferase|nr:glycosyltransferase [Gemmatimonadota bacterium]
MAGHNVLIVSASTGTGHIRAGEAVREALGQHSPEASVRHVDLLSLAPGWVRRGYGTGYELMASRAPWAWERVYRHTDGDGTDHARWSGFADHVLFREFRQLLLSRRWDVVVSTHFLPCQLAAGKPGMPPFALSITDFTVHRFWVQPRVGRYFVATDDVAADLRRRLPAARVDVTGIPISPLTATGIPRLEARSRLGMDPERSVVMVAGGGLGLGVVEMTRSVLAGAPADVQIVAVCGRNEAAREALSSLDLPAERLRVMGYVTGMEAYLAASDVVVTKPGGLTTSEALAIGRPLVLTLPIPGQETGNTRALVAAGAALPALSDRELREVTERIFTRPELRRELEASARRIGRPRSALDVAERISREYLTPARRRSGLPVSPGEGVVRVP